MITLPHDRPFILVLRVPRSSRNSDGVTPFGGAKYSWGIKIARFSTNKLQYLANDTRYRHRCYGRRIGTHTRFIKWCHFQWPWMHPNPIFKVRSFFDAEYLQNGCRYGHSYYGRRIWDRTQAFVPNYVVDPFWMSLYGDRVGEATPRHGRRYYEFTDAKYYGHTVVDLQQVN